MTIRRHELCRAALVVALAFTGCEDEGEECDANEKARCEGGDVLECVTDDDGESRWQVTEDCGSGSCDETVDGASCV